MEFFVEKARRLCGCAIAGCAAFMLLGYVAKVVPAFGLGVALIFGCVNLFGLYLFWCYPELREEVGIGVVVEILGGILLWI
jgi:hypothetical protein